MGKVKSIGSSVVHRVVVGAFIFHFSFCRSWFPNSFSISSRGRALVPKLSFFLSFFLSFRQRKLGYAVHDATSESSSSRRVVAN